ncbi:TPA: sigma factor-like helix-turn-helix DNA-binding protein [Stenotrophomonas maltophilia]|uniref:helix-turn-helix domain-containing protein n=1 Tax=Stenotrophomonas geniculata TaxID=86188 RepID=UPI00372936C8
MDFKGGGMLDGWIGTEVGELSDESAVEIIKNWMSLSLQRSDGISDIHAKTGIQRKRLVKLFSSHCQVTPRPEEISKISAATGYPAHDLVVQAADYLSPAVLNINAPERSVELPRTSRNALKLWLRSARRDNPGGRLTQMELAERIGRSHMSVAAWENIGTSRIPKYKDICAIAEACGVEPPGPDFDVRQGQAIQAEVKASMSPPADLHEEILFNGRLLSRRAHAPSHVERNALVFRARYGGQGDAESTLRAIGEIHGITRERIRQIVDKQLSFLPTTPVIATQFDALVEACQDLGVVAVAGAEERLRSLLGGTLSLQGAIDYGREVLGRSLPVQIIRFKKGEPVVLAG